MDGISFLKTMMPTAVAIAYIRVMIARLAGLG
jgi:hypothetical protein